MECFICGAKEDKTTLFNAVIKEGIVKICDYCSDNEDIPIIKGRNNLHLKDSEKNQTVYERLSRMAGLDHKEHKTNIRRSNADEELKKQNEELRKIANKKSELVYPSLKQIKSEEKTDLMRNYHWTIFQVRRARRLTQKDLAEAIAEPEASIKLIERGILPKDYHPFIRKIQTYLGINLFNKPIKENKEVGFDKFSSKSLTISDLQDIKEKVESSQKVKFFPYWRKKLGFLQKKREDKKIENPDINRINSQNKIPEKDKKSKNELTQEEMDEILFG